MSVAAGSQLNGMLEQASTAVYWHRELPPRDAEAIGGHTIEATSGRVSGTLAHRDEMWDRCYRELMERVRLRLEQEIVRLGGNYARVLSEHIEPRHDDRTGEAWMYGRFDYELYRGSAKNQVGARVTRHQLRYPHCYDSCDQQRWHCPRLLSRAARQ